MKARRMTFVFIISISLLFIMIAGISAWAMIKGDTDQNGVVDIKDVTVLLNRLASADPLGKENDVNEDGEINISDVSALLNILSGGEPEGTEGLIYKLNEDKASYTVAGISEEMPEKLVIPGYYRGLPVVSVKSYAFVGADEIKEVILSEGIKTIEEKSFWGCNNIRTLYLPHSLETIKKEAFLSCTALETLSLPATVKVLEPYAFSDTALLHIEVRGNGGNYYAQNDCLISKSDKTLVIGCINSVIPNDGSVLKIGEEAFSGCSRLKTVSLPSSITEIGARAFKGCSGLISAKLDCAATVLPSSIFEMCSSLAEVQLPTGLTEIGKNAFYGCASLKKIRLPETVNSVGESAFAYTALETLALPAKVTEISSRLLIGCGSLQKFTVPKGVTKIGKEAFCGCTALESISIPETVTQIETGAFKMCTGLNEIKVDAGNKRYSEKGGCLLDKNSGTLIKGTNGCSVPYEENFKVLGEYALYGCTGVTVVRLPATLETIEAYCLANCPDLKTVYFLGDKEAWNRMIGFHWKDNSSFSVVITG